METQVDTRNDAEIRLFAMRRSGSHAFLDWLIALATGKVCFLNDFTRSEGISPEHPSSELPALDGHRRTQLHQPKELLMYNFEDEDLSKYGDTWLASALSGGSRRRISILLLRDPYNLFASRLKTRRNLPGKEFATEMAPLDAEGKIANRQLWIQHAREFEGETSYLGEGNICVSYNRWLFEADYRQSLCAQIGFKYSEVPMNRIPRQGYGSSVEGYRDGVLKNRLGLLYRWRSFNEDTDEEYKLLLDDPELHRLSREIFGELRD